MLIISNGTEVAVHPNVRESSEEIPGILGIFRLSHVNATCSKTCNQVGDVGLSEGLLLICCKRNVPFETR